MKNKIFTLKDRTLSVDLSEIEYIYLGESGSWWVGFKSHHAIEVLDAREAHKVQAAWEAYNAEPKEVPSSEPWNSEKNPAPIPIKTDTTEQPPTGRSVTSP